MPKFFIDNLIPLMLGGTFFIGLIISLIVLPKLIKTDDKEKLFRRISLMKVITISTCFLLFICWVLLYMKFESSSSLIIAGMQLLVIVFALDGFKKWKKKVGGGVPLKK